MREISLSADKLVSALLNLPKEQRVCLLDSCNVSHLGSHLLIAGFGAVEMLEISEKDAEKTLEILDEKLSRKNSAAFLTISYDFGLKLNRISPPRRQEFSACAEPDVFLALFDCLIIHDYNTRKTYLTGNETRFADIETALFNSLSSLSSVNSPAPATPSIFSNFSRENYLLAIEQIQEYIRSGDTYQTNLTQQLRVALPDGLTPEQIFLNLRARHPAPFASFIRRKNDVVISASPERFFKVQGPNTETRGRRITVSPIKGTRPRGKTPEEDLRLKKELLSSEKDRAENIMIVDLLRNDLGRVCQFGSVEVEKLCDLEIHPTLYHLVSTVNGKLRENIDFSDILRAVFPCGSITGAPKIRTMQIIEEIETAARGLSMGAIGYAGFDKTIDLSVAIRTMTVRENQAVFNVGGGIVIDSVPEEEYAETMVKARALLNALGADSV